MADAAVSLQNVSKKFRLFNSPKERLLEALHPFNKQYHKEFWALKNISFKVKKGTTIGIIGRNGAGKSTLLEIICSILKPTSGTIAVNGRVSTLLALGAGFNPEFTGRQNVLMNGSLMGFSQSQMQKRLPEIEAFADIGEFIDQPMKIYSSGMSLRLGFAAAVNVEPDILVVDEALAVGDAKFQHKCYGKFLEFQKHGKTIIFVTHDTEAVIRHCDEALLLENGAIVETGAPKRIVDYYLDLLFTGKITDYQFSPVLVEEDFKGFNIVHYKKKYYALSQSLGVIDFIDLEGKRLNDYVNEKKILSGSSIEEVKDLAQGATLELPPQAINQTTKTSELEKFLQEIPTSDNCLNRKSYNQNEYRYGNKQAEIVDYLISCQDKLDVVSINSGDLLHIYVKIKYHNDISSPMTGFAIKTKDGVLVYGTNTKIERRQIHAMVKGDLVVFRWDIKLSLTPGDYFIDLGCGEFSQGVSFPLDRRYGIIYLRIHSRKETSGLLYCEAGFEELSRKSSSASYAKKGYN